ncbi:MAG: GNAT family N-acetyltransferase [bacterium]
MSAEIHYQRLNADNFTAHSLDDFVRRQTVIESWRWINKDWKLVPNVFEENWPLVQCREIAEDMVHHINLDQTGFGAFDGERIIGFATVSHHIFGAAAVYVQLVCFQISEGYRRQGIGRKLFSLACEEARLLGADKLYISAHSSKESQAAYRALGCTPAKEINEGLAAAEPYDVQMEYRL